MPLTERRDIGSRLENWGRVLRDVLQPSPVPDRRRVDVADAKHVDAAMRSLPALQRSLLWWCYVRQAKPEVVCRRLGICARPAVQFVAAFQLAQAAIEQLVDAAALPQEG